MNDELDEIDNSDGGSMLNTRTLLWNVEDLENPVHVGSHIADVEAIDHNLYVRGNRAYLANYCSGLRILDSTQVRENHTSTLEKKPIMKFNAIPFQMNVGLAPEMAYFDAADYCEGAIFGGVWSVYPFFDSGNVIMSSIELGLFILRPDYEQIN